MLRATQRRDWFVDVSKTSSREYIAPQSKSENGDYGHGQQITYLTQKEQGIVN